MDTETGEGVRGVKPTREELREAIEYAISVLGRKRYRGGNDAHDGYEAHATLRAFLDSGLTDSERETVAKVVAAIRTAASQIEMAMEPRTNEDYSVMDNAIVAILKQAAALAPIAEGK